ncbi:hypothetical protein [Alteribacillus iranensis]|uniref:N-acetyltransferase domain-containing protein n=1 Tax=Alteribacillus iranensis TaxID=930128 RepID=A0A1I2BFQ6_9BACI|nr:hypothetical protein [Alteribacillus iranensis]SFE55014.1 hypothetical protein SAMN05192532_102280 [Alteribacillus iranensis]
MGQFYLLNTYTSVDRSDILSRTDEVSGDLFDVMGDLYEVLEEDDLGFVAVMAHFKIDEEYRGEGYGKVAFEKIIKYFELLNVDYFALIPYPVEIEREDVTKQDIQKLVKFYQAFHLNIVKQNSDTQLVMGET